MGTGSWLWEHGEWFIHQCMVAAVCQWGWDLLPHHVIYFYSPLCHPLFPHALYCLMTLLKSFPWGQGLKQPLLCMFVFNIPPTARVIWGQVSSDGREKLGIKPGTPGYKTLVCHGVGVSYLILSYTSIALSVSSGCHPLYPTEAECSYSTTDYHE